eukprot:281519_1
MMVMKRYCDYDYDNNCIILFDATDAEQPELQEDELDICWISSGNHPIKKKKLEKTEPKEDTHPTPIEHEETEEKVVPLYQYIERKHDKKMMKLQQTLNQTSLASNASRSYQHNEMQQKAQMNLKNPMHYHMMQYHQNWAKFAHNGRHPQSIYSRSYSR